MKKSISVLLAILLLCALTACSNTSKGITKNTTSSYQSTHKSEELTAQQAKDVAIEYLNSPLGKRELNDKLLDKISASSIKYLEITSIENTKNELSNYKFAIKGNFFGYDSYGTLKNQYIYTWNIMVDKSTKEASVLYGTVYLK